MARPGIGLRWLAIAGLLTLVVVPGRAASLHAVVIAPQPDHIAWASARILQDHAERKGLEVLLASGASQPSEALPDLIVMPVRSLASKVPSFEVLELPFLFEDINAVHRALDGPLGNALRARARQFDWEILGFWDEGLHVMSGLRRYDRVVNLNGMEFLLTRPDPVAERQLRAWRATARTIQAANREAVLRECLIASRAATLQEIKREGLERVHMTLALTRHRYEGWLLLAPSKRWDQLSESTRAALAKVLPQVTRHQRVEAARREVVALAALREAGLVMHALGREARNAFIERLPPWHELLSNEIDEPTRRRLLGLAGISDYSSHSKAAQRAPETAR